MKLTRLVTLASIFIAPVTFAHVGHHAHEAHHAFSSGLIHPVTGFDHLVMLFGFGMLINRYQSLNSTKTSALSHAGEKSKLSLLVAALMSLIAGLGLGNMMGTVNGIELMIAGSVFVVALGVWMAFSHRESLTKMLTFTSLGLVFFHGFAHGVEAVGSVAQFGAGMAISATALMVVGERVAHLVASKWLGAGLALSGAALMLAV